MPKGFFDFEEVVKKDDGFDEIVENARKNVQKSSTNSTRSSQNYSLYAIIFVLVASLIGLSIYAFRNQEGTQNTTIASQPQREFIQEPNRLENILSGQSFSVVVDQQTPENFQISEEEVDFVFLNNQKGIVTKILAANEVRGGLDTSGIEVYSTEYDNRLNINSFAGEVQQSLGSGYSIDGDIEIPKGFKLIKISNNNDTSVIYYTGVTSENYYVIKSINTAQDHSTLDEYSSFIDKMIYGLYLN